MNACRSDRNISGFPKVVIASLALAVTIRAAGVDAQSLGHRTMSSRECLQEYFAGPSVDVQYNQAARLPSQNAKVCSGRSANHRLSGVYPLIRLSVRALCADACPASCIPAYGESTCPIWGCGAGPPASRAWHRLARPLVFHCSAPLRTFARSSCAAIILGARSNAARTIGCIVSIDHRHLRIEKRLL